MEIQEESLKPKRNGGTVFSVPLSANTGTACTVPAFFQISSEHKRTVPLCVNAMENAVKEYPVKKPAEAKKPLLFLFERKSG